MFLEILYKPVERVMRNTLVLQDLLKHTPHRHPDYHTLRQVVYSIVFSFSLQQGQYSPFLTFVLGAENDIGVFKIVEI